MFETSTVTIQFYKNYEKMTISQVLKVIIEYNNIRLYYATWTAINVDKCGSLYWDYYVFVNLQYVRIDKEMKSNEHFS